MKRLNIKRWFIVAIIAIFAAGAWIFHLDQYLTLTSLKGSLDVFKVLYNDHRAIVLGVYFIIYVLIAALSLPGAAPLGMLGGALFGFWPATLVVSFASTIGATLACSVSRFLLRDYVQNKFVDKLARVNEGIETEGAFYLFSLRLIPVFPFWTINLLMGITKMPLSKFYWVSQVGMLPGTMVFVNAGKELAKIETLKGIFSPGLVISFVLIGILPVTIKKAVVFYRSRAKQTQPTP